MGETTPRLCNLLSDVSAVQTSCGGAHTVVVAGITPQRLTVLLTNSVVVLSTVHADSGSVFSMGLNEDGQLGHSSQSQFVPVGIV